MSSYIDDLDEIIGERRAAPSEYLMQHPKLARHVKRLRSNFNTGPNSRLGQRVSTSNRNRRFVPITLVSIP